MQTRCGESSEFICLKLSITRLALISNHVWYKSQQRFTVKAPAQTQFLEMMWQIPERLDTTQHQLCAHSVLCGNNAAQTCHWSWVWLNLRTLKSSLTIHSLHHFVVVNNCSDTEWLFSPFYLCSIGCLIKPQNEMNVAHVIHDMMKFLWCFHDMIVTTPSKKCNDSQLEWKWKRASINGIVPPSDLSRQRWQYLASSLVQAREL